MLYVKKCKIFGQILIMWVKSIIEKFSNVFFQCLALPKDLNMFLKPVWVGKIHGVGVYATHSVRIWWFRNKFSLFQLKRM